MESDYVSTWLVILFTFFIIILLVFVVPNEVNCDTNITSISDIINVGNCIKDELAYELTPDNQPLQISILKGKGDCYDRAKYLRYVLNNNNITNSVQICNIVGTNNNAMHARNLVFLNNQCYIVDTTILLNNNIIIRSCNYRPDYCV